ncbi:hypothetical protein [Aeromicrobium sp.]|uniref:hypothetical protein n=1 Tax=Aeromicrobium sp. TaxID=1871063 RepID=UPI00403330EC
MTESRRFADAFTDALEARGAGLSWLRSHLADRGHAVSLASLSYWRSGQREPQRQISLEALVVIEELLGLHEGALSSHLRRRGRTGPAPFDDLVGLARQVGRDRGLVGEDEVDRIAFDLVVDVGADRRVSQVRVTQVFVAAVDGAAGVTMFVAPGVGTGTTEFEGLTDFAADTVMRAVAGCSVDGVVDIIDGISAARLSFDRPLALGESVATEVVMVPLTDEAATDAEWGAVAEQRLEHCTVWVRFHPDRLPRAAWVGFQEAGLEHEWPVALDGGTGLLHRQTDFGPGLCTARWEW